MFFYDKENIGVVLLIFYLVYIFSHMIYFLDLCRIMNQYYLRKSNINTDIKSCAISATNLEQILFGKPNQHKYQNKCMDLHENTFCLIKKKTSEGDLKFKANDCF